MRGWLFGDPHTTLKARAEALQDKKQALKDDITNAVLNAQQAIEQMKEHHAKLTDLHGEVHRI